VCGIRTDLHFADEDLLPGVFAVIPLLHAITETVLYHRLTVESLFRSAPNIFLHIVMQRAT
jgi:hypothetical protein